MTEPTLLLKVHSQTHKKDEYPLELYKTDENICSMHMHGLSRLCRLVGVRAVLYTDRARLGSYLSFGAEFKTRQHSGPRAVITVIKIYYEFCCQMRRNFKRGFTNLSEDNTVSACTVHRSAQDVWRCAHCTLKTPGKTVAERNQFDGIPELSLNYYDQDLCQQNSQILVKWCHALIALLSTKICTIKA